MNECWVLSNAFGLSMDIRIGFFIFSLLMW